MMTSDVFQDVLMRDGGAEAVFRAALGEARPLHVTVGAASNRGLREAWTHLGEPRVIMELDDGESMPHEGLAKIAGALLDLPSFQRPLLSFHHHFGLLVSSNAGAAYYMHTPTRFLHEPERVPWELPHLNATLRKDLVDREVETLSAARLVVTNSSETKRRISRHYGVASVVLHPPTELWRHASPSRVQTRRGSFVLTVSRLSKSKHLEACLDAVKRTGMEWLVVGEGPPEVIERLRGGATLLGRLDRDSIAALIRDSSVCLSPAREDFGIFAAEAMSLGVPTVAQAGSGIFDLADLGVLHAFADPGTDAGTSLEQALGTASTAVRPGSAQVSRIREHLSVEGFRQSLWQFMDSVRMT